MHSQYIKTFPHMYAQVIRRMESPRVDLFGVFLSNKYLTCIEFIGEGKVSDSCEISYRADEKYWVTANKTEVTVSFAL